MQSNDVVDDAAVGSSDDPPHVVPTDLVALAVLTARGNLAGAGVNLVLPTTTSLALTT